MNTKHVVPLGTVNPSVDDAKLLESSSGRCYRSKPSPRTTAVLSEHSIRSNKIERGSLKFLPSGSGRVPFAWRCRRAERYFRRRGNSKKTRSLLLTYNNHQLKYGEQVTFQFGNGFVRRCEYTIEQCIFSVRPHSVSWRSKLASRHASNIEQTCSLIPYLWVL